ncbi:MAG: DUF485 domain-containing protein [Planctomycetaceae bacterium]
MQSDNEAQTDDGEVRRIQNHNARMGIILFTIYLVLYGGFVFLNAFAADMMESTPFAGLNIAILYGFALIIGAFVMSLVYGALCRNPLHRPSSLPSHNSATSGSSSVDSVEQELKS